MAMPEQTSRRPLTVEDLEGMPDDGNRYELLDGELLVSPSPSRWHQRAVVQLTSQLNVQCPEGMEVLSAPFAVQPSRTTELQPDVLVAREADLTDKLLPVGPVLAVEVLSPSSLVTDFNRKKTAYERMGADSYWVIDPLDPKLTVFELNAEGRYELVAEVKGDDPFDAVRPFPVRIVPNELLSLWMH